MKKQASYLLFSLLLLHHISLYSQNKRDYKLSKVEFLNHPSIKDSILRTTVNLFWDARIKSLQKAYAFPISLGFTTLCSAIYFSQKNQNNNLSGIATYGIGFGLLSSIISIPITIKGYKLASKYSRKNLFNEIMQVQNGHKSSKQLLEETVREYYLDFGE